MDLFEDLIEEEASSKENLLGENRQLKLDLAKCRQDCKELTEKCSQLAETLRTHEINASCLLKTARNEINRKHTIIAGLRKQIEELAGKKAKGIGRQDLEKAIENIKELTKSDEQRLFVPFPNSKEVKAPNKFKDGNSIKIKHDYGQNGYDYTVIMGNCGVSMFIKNGDSFKRPRKRIDLTPQKLLGNKCRRSEERSNPTPGPSGKSTSQQPVEIPKGTPRNLIQNGPQKVSPEPLRELSNVTLVSSRRELSKERPDEKIKSPFEGPHRESLKEPLKVISKETSDDVTKPPGGGQSKGATLKPPTQLRNKTILPTDDLEPLKKFVKNHEASKSVSKAEMGEKSIASNYKKRESIGEITKEEKPRRDFGSKNSETGELLKTSRDGLKSHLSQMPREKSSRADRKSPGPASKSRSRSGDKRDRKDRRSHRDERDRRYERDRRDRRRDERDNRRDIRRERSSRDDKKDYERRHSRRSSDRRKGDVKSTNATLPSEMRENGGKASSAEKSQTVSRICNNIVPDTAGNNERLQKNKKQSDEEDGEIISDDDEPSLVNKSSIVKDFYQVQPSKKKESNSENLQNTGHQSQERTVKNCTLKDISRAESSLKKTINAGKVIDTNSPNSDKNIGSLNVDPLSNLKKAFGVKKISNTSCDESGPTKSSEKEKLIWKVDPEVWRNPLPSAIRYSYFGPEPPENLNDINSQDLDRLIEQKQKLMEKLLMEKEDLMKNEVKAREKIQKSPNERSDILQKVVKNCSNDAEASSLQETKETLEKEKEVKSKEKTASSEVFEALDESAMDGTVNLSNVGDTGSFSVLDDLQVSNSETYWGSEPFMPNGKPETEEQQPRTKPRYSSGPARTPPANSEEPSSSSWNPATPNVAEILRTSLVSGAIVSPNSGIIRTPTDPERPKSGTKKTPTRKSPKEINSKIQKTRQNLFKEKTEKAKLHQTYKMLGLEDSNSCSNSQSVIPLTTPSNDLEIALGLLVSSSSEEEDDEPKPSKSEKGSPNLKPLKASEKTPPKTGHRHRRCSTSPKNPMEKTPHLKTREILRRQGRIVTSSSDGTPCEDGPKDVVEVYKEKIKPKRSFTIEPSSSDDEGPARKKVMSAKRPPSRTSISSGNYSSRKSSGVKNSTSKTRKISGNHSSSKRPSSISPPLNQQPKDIDVSRFSILRGLAAGNHFTSTPSKTPPKTEALSMANATKNIDKGGNGSLESDATISADRPVSSIGSLVKSKDEESSELSKPKVIISSPVATYPVPTKKRFRIFDRYEKRGPDLHIVRPDL